MLGVSEPGDDGLPVIRRQADERLDERELPVHQIEQIIPQCDANACRHLIVTRAAGMHSPPFRTHQSNDCRLNGLMNILSSPKGRSLFDLIQSSNDLRCDLFGYLAHLFQHHQVGPVHQQIGQEYPLISLTAGQIIENVLADLPQTLIPEHIRWYSWRSHSHTHGSSRSQSCARSPFPGPGRCLL